MATYLDNPLNIHLYDTDKEWYSAFMNQNQNENHIVKNKKYNKKTKTMNQKKDNLQKIDFKIPEYCDYEKFKNTKYTVVQLKEICKKYKLKRGGKKQELVERIYDYLYYSYYAIKIQSVFKGYIVRKFNKLHGPALFNKKICVNESDFCTLENLDEIPYYQYISFTFPNSHIYGFDICSLYNYIEKHKNNSNNTELPLNPYDRQPLPEDILKRIYDYIKISKLLKYKINIKIDNKINFLTLREKNIHKIKDIFQKINHLGNYSNYEWFTQLNKLQLIRFFKELVDIWNHRAQLTNETKINICPPLGRPFFTLNLTGFHHLNIEQIFNQILPTLDKLVSTGTSNDYKSLGAYYILAALTLVNSDAANSLPWLYQSVV